VAQWTDDRRGSRLALDRFTEQVPGATRRDVTWDIAGGIEISRELAASILGRAQPASTSSIYVIGRARMDLHVIGPSVKETDHHSHRLVTYLRFGLAQKCFVRCHFKGAP